MKHVKTLFPDIATERPLVIAGPCSAESEEQVMSTATALATSGIKVFRAGIWKPRTKPGGFEGVGSVGLQWLQAVQAHTGMKTATEVATPKHVDECLKHGIDLLWIGARTATNPFAMQEVADALRGVDIPVLIKNPVTPDLDLWIGGIERIANAGVKRLGIIHRGFTAYEKKIYRNQPHWSIPVELRRRMPELFFCCDPSHMGGSCNLLLPLSQQALDMNFDGLMIESHCCPDQALSDKKQQVTPAGLLQLLQQLVVRDNTELNDLSLLRSRIDEIDKRLLELLSHRMEISREIGVYKKENAIAILQSTRYAELLQNMINGGEKLGLDPEFIRAVMQLIHEESSKEQMKIMN